MTFRSGRTIIGAMLWASGVALAFIVLWHVPDVRAAVPDNAGSCRVPRDLIIERPGAGREPVSVGVAIFLVNIRNIREPSETFEAELTLRVNC